MAIDFPANDPQQWELENSCVTAELMRVFLGRLSRTEKDLWIAMNDDEAKSDSQEGASLYRKFDDALIEQATALGWRIYLSSVVRLRLSQWSDHEWEGVERLKRLNAAIIRHAEVKRGMVRLPFTEPEWPQTWKNALREIKALKKRLSSQVALGNEQPTVAEAAANASRAIRAEIAAKPTTYQYLSANLFSFIDYLERHSLGPVFVTGQITPGTVLGGWFDYQGSTADDKSRQIISRIASQKRR
jgi:hypothetical protein